MLHFMNSNSFERAFKDHQNNVCLTDEHGQEYTFGQVLHKATGLSWAATRQRKLVFLEFANTVEAIASYVACLISGHVVFPYAQEDTAKVEQLVKVYDPNVWIRSNCGKLHVAAQHDRPVDLHPDLRLLLSTSGSTGTPKFVKLTEQNIHSNAESIAKYLCLDSRSSAITSLKPSYSYGLSVINSHFVVGGRLQLTERSVTDPEFWKLLRKSRVGSFAGVPYTYELILSQSIDLESFPDLRYMTQAGGRLREERILHFAQLCRATNKNSMSCTVRLKPRLAWPTSLPNSLLEAPGSIGIAIPGGTLSLRDEQGRTVEDVDVVGEITYSGPNVMVGYAVDREDLANVEFIPELWTGDMGRRRHQRLLLYRRTQLAIPETVRHANKP